MLPLCVLISPVLENLSFSSAHLLNPLAFITKQLILMIPFILFFLFLTLKIKTKLNLKDKKLIFLIIVNFLPILLVFFTKLSLL
jgi:membrane-associated HD superfamily phosphohydrolase